MGQSPSKSTGPRPITLQDVVAYQCKLLEVEAPDRRFYEHIVSYDSDFSIVISALGEKAQSPSQLAATELADRCHILVAADSGFSNISQNFSAKQNPRNQNGKS